MLSFITLLGCLTCQPLIHATPPPPTRITSVTGGELWMLDARFLELRVSSVRRVSDRWWRGFDVGTHVPLTFVQEVPPALLTLVLVDVAWRHEIAWQTPDLRFAISGDLGTHPFLTLMAPGFLYAWVYVSTGLTLDAGPFRVWAEARLYPAIFAADDSEEFTVTGDLIGYSAGVGWVGRF